METYPVLLWDTAAGGLVEATLTAGLPADRIVAAEAAWAPFRRALPDEAEHSHWDWSLKTGLLTRPGVRCLGVEYAGRMQGMAMLRETGYTARLPPARGRPLVYVDFLEAAPWNAREALPSPRYKLVGRRLMDAAVGRSRQLGCGGRPGLHSLRQAEPFYELGCGMTPCGQDPAYNRLMYFEFTAERAAEYLPVEENP